MERLLADAQKLTGVEYNIDNLGDVYDAIHVIQGDLGLTGVAAAEASETFSGSFNAMKAAASNFLGSLALGEGVSESLSTLLSATSTFFFNNFLPMLGQIIMSLPGAIATLLKKGLPLLVKNVTSLINKLTKSIVKFADGVTGPGISKWANKNVPKILEAGAKLMLALVKAIITNLPKIAAAVRQIALAILTGLGAYLWDKMKAIFSAGLNAIKMIWTTAWNSIKATAVSIWNGIRASAASIWNSIKIAITTPISSARSTVSSIVSSIRASVSGAFSGLASKVRSAFNSVKTAITQPIQNAISVVKSAVSKIKGLFPLHIGEVFSGLKLPHFKIISKGKFPWGIAGKGSVPEWRVSWYKTGGIFDSPSLIGVGEAGSEAVVPLDRFWKTLEGMNTGETNIVINVNGAGDPRAVAEEVKRMLIRETNQRRLAWQ